MAFSTMREALKALADRTGQAALEPNAAGAVELVIAGRLPVYFQVVGETELEVQIRLPELESAMNMSMVSALLEANLHTAHGRFALEPGTNKAIFGGRINVTGHDAETFMKAIDAIIKEGARWNGSGAKLLEGFALRGSGSADVMNETLLRV